MSTVLRWQKSTFSGPDDGNACVELATSPAGVHFRESDDPGELLTTTPGPLGAFIRAAKAGEFDHLTP
ncbi:DUF397 domain-containing protein [Streptomyces sp. NEAU-S77]|uniref:DUF397 domain-containing protein n=1 Tax=Streptomyces sp. NEAU-S77 TaxID=3411033 RepID=UPI003BA3BF7D